MKLRKIVLIVGLMAVFTMLTPGLQVWAGGGPEPGETATIHGPEVWGVVILDCTNMLVTLRVKGIENCVVYTQAFVQTTGWTYGCTDDPTAPLDWALVGITFLDSTGTAIPGTPFITKVKNFKIDGNLRSFDAQFKFYE